MVFGHVHGLTSLTEHDGAVYPLSFWPARTSNRLAGDGMQESLSSAPPRYCRRVMIRWPCLGEDSFGEAALSLMFKNVKSLQVGEAREPPGCVPELESLTSKENAMTFKFTYFGAWFPGLLVASTLVAQAGPACKQWNTREFFLTATVEEVTSCLAAGGDIEAQTENGRMPLHYAAWSSKNPAVVKTLVEAGAKLEARSNNGNTPLILAAWGNKNPAVIEALLAAGADPRVRNKSGNTPAARCSSGKQESGGDRAAARGWVQPGGAGQSRPHAPTSGGWERQEPSGDRPPA